MVGRSEGLLYDIGQGYSALDAQAARDRLDGFAVINGLKVTTDGSDLTLDVGSSAGGGSATVGQSSGSVDTVSLSSAGTVTLDAADSTNPRKDVVYIDTSGTLQVETGVAEPADPSGNVRFETFQPEPPEPSTAGTILAEVWVAAGTSSIASSDIRDRRQPAEVVVDALRGESVSVDTSFSDAAGASHTGELADASDLLDVEDDGTVVVSDALALNAGSNLSVTDDGDQTVTLDASGGGGSDLGYENVVADHGAAGDGSTDDTTAIQDAADAASPDGTVFFPPGSYLVSSPINLKGASVDGAGMFEAIVLAATGNSWDVGISSTGGDQAVLYAHNQNEWSVQNIGVDAQGEDAAGVVNFGGNDVHFTSCHVTASDDSGIQHWGGTGSNTNDCFNVSTADCHADNCRWNFVLDGGIFNGEISDCVSHEADVRHISVDNRTHNDTDMRTISVSGNVLRAAGGDGSAATEAIYLRGGASTDDQRSSDGIVWGECKDNEIYGWPGIGTQITRAGVNLDGNRYHGDGTLGEFSGVAVIDIDQQIDSTEVTNNTIVVGSAPSYIIDHSDASSGNVMYVFDNKNQNGSSTFFNGGTDAAWVFDRNYSGTSTVTP